MEGPEEREQNMRMRKRLGRRDRRGRLSHLEAWDLVGRANRGENENGHEVVNWMRWYLGLTAERGGESDGRGAVK